jgi:hypothetical protein
MTDQEIFDKVATHLLTQMQPSESYYLGQCAYRGDGDLMCAVGCLIPDELYNSAIEGYRVHNVVGTNIILYEFLTKDSYGPEARIEFLASLQRIHDTIHPECWKEKLSEAADQYNLDSSVLNNF